MTVIEKIPNYLKATQGKMICDDCLSKHLRIIPRQTIQKRTSQLAKSILYQRVRCNCSICKRIKLSIGEKLALAS